jgi:hypothetical protein
MTGERLAETDPALGSFEFRVVPEGSTSRVVGSSGGAGVPVPPGLDAARALTAPLVARALAVWSELGLELGQAAVISGEGRFAALLSLVARWRGALPSVLLRQGQGPAGVVVVPFRPDDPERSLNELKLAIAARPAAAFVDVSGRASVLDLLFDALPRYGRLMLAGRAGERATVDYYNHWHRKGAVILARLIDPAADLEASTSDTSGVHIARAFRLLADDARAAACLACWQSDQDGSEVRSTSPSG